MDKLSTLNGLEIADEKARQDISNLDEKIDTMFEEYINDIAKLVGGDA